MYTDKQNVCTGREQWTLVTAAGDRAPEADRRLLLSNEGSQANVHALREYAIF